MGICRTKCCFFYFLVLLHFVYLTGAQIDEYPTADLSTSWFNNSSSRIYSLRDGSRIRPILSTQSISPGIICGFFCNGTCDSYLFAVIFVDSLYSLNESSPQLVWSANRNNPVGMNATLHLTSVGDLVLKDGDGNTTWSTNTSGQSIASLSLIDQQGNLVLFDDNKFAVWQSFDQPTDCLLLGQWLMEGQQLTPSVSTTNWAQSGLISLSLTKRGLFASVGSNPPQVYFNITPFDAWNQVFFRNSSLALISNFFEFGIDLPMASSTQVMRFGADGHLRVYEWQGTSSWVEVADVFARYLDDCSYPTVCGNYGICANRQCSCPQPNYFNQINDRQPNLGCSEITPLSCEASHNHSFVELMDTTYFAIQRDYEYMDLGSCKLACLNSCSCKAAVFQYDVYYGNGNGSCYLPSQIFSLHNGKKKARANANQEDQFIKSVVYIKVQDIRNEQNVSTTVPTRKKRTQMPKIVRYSLPSFFSLLFLIGMLVLFVWKKRDANEVEEDHLDQVPGMLVRFSYKDLKAMTANFTKLLGEGGFGSVFEGTLIDGTKIAVKHLNGLGQVKKSFVAEVHAIGGIHHVNLVRLLGFCADKSHRLLVYEYMPNGSLEKWIFHKTSHDFALDWEQRKKIIIDIAKGLTYLHEDCRQKIIHLDIKPQNILLDDTFSAKISDFGLSKLINRNQSKIVTTMRGTPGYLAPEWLSSVITEKVDIYSFGVVVLEILCGRRNFDPSWPEDQRHLVKIFEKNGEEDQLLGLVDNHINDMQVHRAEILKMMRVAVWCLQSDYAERPSMSVVVKVLEGVMEVQHTLDYTISNPTLEGRISRECTMFLPSILSGPR